jgi:hypothetical protein
MEPGLGTSFDLLDGFADFGGWFSSISKCQK